MTRAGLLLVFSLALAAPLGAGAEEIVTVSGRADATQSYLLLHDAPPPVAVAVLFPGGEGLLGLSRGTISAAYAGRELNGAIDGVILTSTVFYGPRRGGGIGIASFDFAAIKAPLLFVHHRYDGCGSCPYHAAENLGRTYPLITVMGGK